MLLTNKVVSERVDTGWCIINYIIVLSFVRNVKLGLYQVELFWIIILAPAFIIIIQEQDMIKQQKCLRKSIVTVQTKYEEMH